MMPIATSHAHVVVWEVDGDHDAWEYIATAKDGEVESVQESWVRDDEFRSTETIELCDCPAAVKAEIQRQLRGDDDLP
jgi:hypothetical protein